MIGTMIAAALTASAEPAPPAIAGLSRALGLAPPDASAMHRAGRTQYQWPAAPAHRGALHLAAQSDYRRSIRDPRQPVHLDIHVTFGPAR